jgi:hypothetical protein
MMLMGSPLPYNLNDTWSVTKQAKGRFRDADREKPAHGSEPECYGRFLDECENARHARSGVLRRLLGLT